MRKSKHTGSVYLPVEGEEIALRYTWGAISELQDAHGQEWEKEVNRICTAFDAPGLAGLLAIGSDKPAEWWLGKSPPFIPAAQAVQQALTVAFFGAGGATDEKNPPTARESTTPASPASRRGASSAGSRASSGG